MSIVDDISLPAHRPPGCPFDPPPAYRRAATRLTLWNGNPCWLLTDYQDVRTVLSDRRFSADVRNPGFPLLIRNQPVARDETPSFLRLDDPEHARLRRMVTTDFLIKRVEAMRPEIQRIVDQALDTMVEHGSPADLVAEFALPVPSLVICDLLGVPYEDHEFFQLQSSRMLDTTAPAESARGAFDALIAYLTELISSKRGRSEGVLAKLAARADLTVRDVAGTGLLLLLAGHETTANMTSLSTLALLQFPAQAEKLRKQPELINGAVEELLRYLTIVDSGLPRVAMEDVELSDGTLVRAGEGVLVMLSTANRDEGLFPGGEQLDVTRDARRHLAFGFGVHQCLGQPLARAELQIALSTLLRRLPTLRLAVPFEEVPFRASVIYGPRELPVAW
ncbi:cytochrome P450 [Kitasatospora kifunensis]|uniref:Cytochrome P450 n=1 Tax=Kitasatospora kifunensis TaxID=58351 RepID=A0A7W7VXK8_KITKI|nr:cytochrome P450 [Kitasatospora kifunensis]MBB4926742.1 cytochrome P450 [Kitasatospora kifunensis]